MTRPLAMTRLRQRATVDYAATVLADAPAAYWRFEDAFGSATAADSSGNARTLTLNGTRGLQAASRNSRLGRCVGFGPSSGYGSVASAAWHQITGDVTLECWLRFRDQLTSGQLMPLFCCLATGETLATNACYRINYENSGGTLRFSCLHEFGSGTNQEALINATIPANGEWNHVVIVRDATALTYSVYINGALAGSGGYSTNAAGGTSAALNIARNPDGGAFPPGRVSWDEAAIYTTVLSASRIFEHYRAGRREPSSFWPSVVLLTRWAGADTDAASPDEASAGRVLTFNGNAQVDTGITTPAGQQSCLMDGTGDYVSVASSADLEVAADQFTIEAFVRIGTGGKIQTICAKRTTASSIFFGIDATERLTFAAYYTGSLFVTASDPNPMATGTWYHVCWQRIAGNVWTIHRDGVLVASTTENQTITTNATPFLIGRDGFTTARDWNGSIGPLRFTKGQSRYGAGNFTPPPVFNLYE